MQILVSLFGNLPLWRQALRGIGAVLCNLIYSLIGWLYHLFMVVARLNILSSEQIQPIYQRVTMILTIVMTFYITFEFVKYVMQPDNFLDKEKGVGNITFRIIVVILLIAFVPKIFTMAYDLQNKIIENQVISKIIIGKKDSNFADLGGSFSSNMLGLFYEVDEDVCHGGCNEEQVIVSKNLSNLATGDSFDISNGINSSESEDTPRIRFDGFMAILVGVFIGYILVMYCIDVGTRYAQIIFLQIMAPVAIMGYLAPKKDNMFQKWWKQCLTTYLDLFIRLAIIHFILLIVEVLGDAYNSNSLFEGIADLNDNVKNFTYIVLVMGLLAFAQKAPKMLSELLPSSGAAGIGFGLGTKDRGFAQMGRLLGATVGSAAGALTGLGTGIAQGLRRRERAISAGFDKGSKEARRAALMGALAGGARGLAGGAARGLWNGGKKGNMFKNIAEGSKKQTQANQKFGNRQENGYTFKEQMEDRARNILGLKSRVNALEEQKAPMKRQQDEYAALAKTNDSLREHAFKKAKDKGLIEYANYAEAEGRLKRLQEDRTLIDSYVDADGKSGADSVAYRQALAKAGHDMKVWKDKATNAYIDSNRKVDDNGNFELDDDGNFVYTDGTLNNLVREREQRLKDYNIHASSNRQIQGVNKDDQIAVLDSDGNEMKDSNGNVIKKYIRELNAEEYDTYVKKVANEESGKLNRDIGTITAEQEAIKREIAGSGIGEDKK